MEILNVTYKCKEGMREKFLEAIKAEGLDAASRAEAGNIKYDYYFAADSPDELFLLEKWADDEAIKSHNAEPHFKRLGEIKADYVYETVLERYTK
ncbi:MAG: antibiotic biosynthesis monooxygenase [Mogibacterium sp.]|nr:antibiotic biosynthesis monooxygenase [Mogibacterium sp.]